MTLSDALTRLVGSPSWEARRPDGIRLALSRQLAVMRIGKSGAYRWAPMFADLVALDWDVLTGEQVAKIERHRALAAQLVEIERAFRAGTCPEEVAVEMVAKLGAPAAEAAKLVASWRSSAAA